MARHWIITNRTVGRRRVNRHFEERVTDTDRKPLPTFRIATFDPPAAANPSWETLERGVRLVPDDHVTRYDDLGPGVDPASLVASRRLFVELYRAMQGSPADKGDVLFFIHGFNYSWPAALRHLWKLHQVYAAPAASPVAHILYFTWPSYGSLARYPSDQEIALPSGLLLGRLMAKTVEFYRSFFAPAPEGAAADFCGHKIHLAVHSMGAQVLEAFLSIVNQNDFLQLSLFGEILLLHADVDWTALQPGRALHMLPEYGERVHVYNHFSDDALRVSEWTKNAEKRLGRHGPKDLGALPPRTLVVDCSGQNDAPMLPPADGFRGSASEIVDRPGGDPGLKERLFDHWGYLYRKLEVDDIHAVLRGESSGSIATRRPKHGPLSVLSGG